MNRRRGKSARWKGGGSVYRNPYSRFEKRELTLNDYLAIDRTVLANERTLLSYGRTALALLILGGSCIKFFDEVWLEIAGFGFIAVAIFIGARGWQRYRRMKHLLSAALEQMTGTATHPLEDGADKNKVESAKADLEKGGDSSASTETAARKTE